MPEDILPHKRLAHHRLTVRATRGALTISAELSLSAPWTILFGPSGSGKTTLLRAACGLLPPPNLATFLRTEPDGTVVDLTSRKPHRRDLSYAPQHASLFPNMDVGANVRFGYESCSSPEHGSTLVDDALCLFSLHKLEDRMPEDLSGGERRRVTLARAFATPSVRLMLLDEPFAGLDRAYRDSLLPRMAEWLASRNIACLSVTHDVEEALQLQAEVIRLYNGSITAQGPAAEVLAEERTRILKALA